MKTILQAIKDEIYYPINSGLVENKLLQRGLSVEAEFSYEVSQSAPYKGALADSLFSLIQAVSVSEGDKSFGALSDSQKRALLVQINKLYSAIGEEEVTLDLTPMVYINC